MPQKVLRNGLKIAKTSDGVFEVKMPNSSVAFD